MNIDISIINKRNSSVSGVYVGHPSPLGNPFHIGTDGTRKQVIQKYRQWFEVQLEDETSQVSREIARLVEKAKRYGDLRLLCWCAPLPCHAEVIKAEIEKRVSL